MKKKKNNSKEYCVACGAERPSGSYKCKECGCHTPPQDYPPLPSIEEGEKDFQPIKESKNEEKS